ncbi:hypothetical protein [Micromonospora sp. NPDC005172]|uniref:hypothetical protein n=1 Tax=Micromonospora sp. NPDC005172 TaxID=3156867 RepID=UPI0033A6D616
MSRVARSAASAGPWAFAGNEVSAGGRGRGGPSPVLVAAVPLAFVAGSPLAFVAGSPAAFVAGSSLAFAAGSSAAFVAGPSADELAARAADGGPSGELTGDTRGRYLSIS